MKNNKTSTVIFVLNVFFIVLVFFADLFNPFEYAIWLLNIMPLLWIPYRNLRKPLIYFTVTLSTILIFSVFFSNTDNRNEIFNAGFYNRSLFVIVLWITAFIQSERENVYKRLNQKIKEIKLSEIALQDSKEQYRKTLDSMIEGCAIIDYNWNYLYVNETNAKHAHLAREDMIGGNLYELIPGIENSMFFKAYKRCMTERIPQQIEADFNFADGSKEWYKIIVQPAPEGIFILTSDITDLKRAEEAYNKSKHVLNLILDHISEGIIVSHAPDGHVIAVSRWGLNHTASGKQAGEQASFPAESYLEQWDIRDLNTHQKVDRSKLPIERALKGETVHGEEWLMMRPDGSSFITSVTAVPVYNEDNSAVINAVATWTDITQRKLAEKKLLENEAKLLDAQKIARIGSYSVDVKNNNEITWSDEMYKIWEVDRDKPLSFDDLWHKIHDDDRDKVKKAILEETKDSDVVETEFRIVLPKHKIKYIQLITRRIFDENGNLITRQGVGIDITERKYTELKLYNVTQELERSNKEVEQFSYAASHDLQEPLRMVASFTKLLEKQLTDKLQDDKSKDYMYFIADGVKRMQTLIQDLLTYARVTTKAKPLKSYDLNNVIDEVLRDLQLAIADSKAEIIIDQLPEVKADPVQIRQLFLNLISNSLKYRNKKRLVIKIDVQLEGKYWKFGIKDNGIGISSEYSEKIFTIFKQLHERDKYPGTGIGLAVCKKIVERHGGRIWVESEEGNGAHFYFTLPVK